MTNPMERRIEALEAMTATPDEGVTCFILVPLLRNGDDFDLLRITAEGPTREWVRRADETAEQFQARVVAEACQRADDSPPLVPLLVAHGAVRRQAVAEGHVGAAD